MAPRPGPALSLPSCLILAKSEIEAGRAVDLPHRAGVPPLSRPNWPGIQRAPGSPLTRRSPSCGDDLQAEQRGRGDVDIGRRVGGIAVKRHAENLTDLAGGRLEFDRRIGDLPVGGPAERGQVEHLERRAINIDEGRSSGWRSAGTSPICRAPENAVTAASPRVMTAVSCARALRGREKIAAKPRKRRTAICRPVPGIENRAIAHDHTPPKEGDVRGSTLFDPIIHSAY